MHTSLLLCQHSNAFIWVVVERTIRTEFTDMGSDVVTLALEATKYDEKKTRNLLISMTVTR